MILFNKKTIIKWKRDNFMKRKKKFEAQLSVKQMLKEELKKQFLKKKKTWLESAYQVTKPELPYRR